MQPEQPLCRQVRVGRLAGWWAVAAGVGLAVTMSWADGPVARWAEQQHKQWLWNWPLQVTELGNAKWSIPLLVVGGAAALAMKRRRWAAGLLHAAAAVGAAGLLVNLVKILACRTRPNFFFETGQGGFDWLAFRTVYELNSFPSGHASNIAALCTAAWLWWPRGWWLWAVVWAVVAGTRVLLLAHWPSDVIAGSYVGLVVSLALWGPIHKATAAVLAGLAGKGGPENRQAGNGDGGNRSQRPQC